jgi:glycosyltransferase involved in cell wall biosynthesis
VIPRGAPTTIGVAGTGGLGIIRVRAVVGAARIVRDCLSARRWARQARADVVVLPHEWASPAGRVPVVNVVQNIMYLDEYGRRHHRLKALLMRAAARGTARYADGTIAVSEIAGDLWRACTGRTALVLPQGVSSTYSSAEPRRPSEDLLVVMTGAAGHKNADLALGAIEIARGRGMRSRIVVVGLPSEAPAELGAEAVACLSRDDLADLYSRARVVMLSSTLESFGLPAFEARASGATVVVAQGTAMAEWLGSCPSVVVARPDARGFADAMATAMSMDDASRQRVDDFDWKTIGGLWEAALREFAVRDANC